MNSDSGINEFILLGQFYAAVHASRPIAVSNSNNRLHPPFTRTNDYLFPVSLKLLAVKLRVGIEKNWSSGVGHWSPEVSSVRLRALYGKDIFLFQLRAYGHIFQKTRQRRLSAFD